MGHYTVESLEEKAREEYGEMFVVMESGVEYEIHYGSRHNITFNEEEGIVEFEGDKDGEPVVGEFPADNVEHVFSHDTV